jgi:hypothetical protein
MNPMLRLFIGCQFCCNWTLVALSKIDFLNRSSATGSK